MCFSIVAFPTKMYYFISIFSLIPIAGQSSFPTNLKFTNPNDFPPLFSVRLFPQINDSKLCTSSFFPIRFHTFPEHFHIARLQILNFAVKSFPFLEISNLLGASTRICFYGADVFQFHNFMRRLI